MTHYVTVGGSRPGGNGFFLLRHLPLENPDPDPSEAHVDPRLSDVPVGGTHSHGRGNLPLSPGL